MPESNQLSVQIKVRGRRCVVVGGGPVALRRTRSLLQAGAKVVVVAPELQPEFWDVAQAGQLQTGQLQILQREFEPSDLATDQAAGSEFSGAPLLVIVATNNPEVNRQVGVICEAAGVLVNRADRAQDGDLSFPATVSWGKVSIAVSNSDGSPVLSQWAAERIDASLDSVLGLTAEQGEQLAQVIVEVRQDLQRAQMESSKTRKDVTYGVPDWRSALDESILVLVRMGRYTEAKERLLACLSS
ncbi:MAG: bifunctional precorrin-2 dehydrogenase/sirohydrochlorin ferrochelatase [Microthrixaceae bacterium]